MNKETTLAEIVKSAKQVGQLEERNRILNILLEEHGDGGEISRMLMRLNKKINK